MEANWINRLVLNDRVRIVRIHAEVQLVRGRIAALIRVNRVGLIVRIDRRCATDVPPEMLMPAGNGGSVSRVVGGGLKTSLHRMVPLKAILHSYCDTCQEEDLRADDDMFPWFQFGCYMNRRIPLPDTPERLFASSNSHAELFEASYAHKCVLK